MTRRALLLGAMAPPDPKLARQLGITTATVAGLDVALPDLPRFLREELDLRVIDLNTNTIKGASRAQLEQFRTNAERTGCIITNLKMNHTGIALDSDLYRKSIDDAAVLGCRWVRALPGQQKPVWAAYVDGLRKLADYAAPRKIGLLIENYGWMEDDADAIPNLVRDIGHGVAAQPDTGNWSNDTVRFAGLAKAFPHAVSCDFKARDLGPDGDHAPYDLRKCFDIGWGAGFRGPWCFEHLPTSKSTVVRGVGLLRDMLRRWMGA